MKYFNECDVFVNSIFGSGLIQAQNASVNVNRSIDSTYTFGRKNASQMIKTKADETTVDFSYFLFSADPIFKCFDYLKTGVFINSFPESRIPIVLKIAGVSGMFYPSRFSLNIVPNSKIQATASFSNYSDISGSLLGKTTSNVFSGGSGLAHSWNVRVSGTVSNTAYNVLGLDYSLSINWNPIYSVGQRRPRQIDLSAGQEDFNFTIEDFNSNFSNSVVATAENAKVNIRTFGGDSIFIIDTSGSKIDSSSMTINVDEYAESKISLKRSF